MNRRHFGHLLLASLGAAVLPWHRAEAKPDVRKIYGKIRFVTGGGEDYKVREVSGGEDLKVLLVDGGASSPGRWQIVNGGGEDFKIRMVSGGGEDFTIRYVKGGEG